MGSLAAALLVVWRRRSNLELTIAVGLLGSVLSAVHEHEPDASMFVLAGWLVLRAPTGTLSRLWLLPGIIAMQTMSIGLAWPIFAWALIWLLLIGIGRSTAGHDSAQTGHVPAATQSRDEAGASARHLAR